MLLGGFFRLGLHRPVLFCQFRLSAVSRVHSQLNDWCLRDARCQTKVRIVAGAKRPAFRRRPTLLVAISGLHSQFWRWTNFLPGMAGVVVRPIPRKGTSSVLSPAPVLYLWEYYTNNLLFYLVRCLSLWYHASNLGVTGVRVHGLVALCTWQCEYWLICWIFFQVVQGFLIYPC